MRIYSKEGDIPYRIFSFPDSQPHVEIQVVPDFDTITIEASIHNSDELLLVLLAGEALRAMGKAVNLDVRYLMGARMDRPIAVGHPATLAVIARLINTAGFHKVRILDPHSDASLALLRASAVYPLGALRTVFQQYEPDQTWVMAPDAGSIYRVGRMLSASPHILGYLQGTKIRNPEDGKLTGFGLVSTPDIKGKDVLILDDICDGGGTFTGMSELLYSKGVRNVDLFVTHGIFSKGVPLKGIRKIWTTDSYLDPKREEALDSQFIRVIPVSMKEM